MAALPTLTLPRLNRPRRQVAAALLFLACATLAGIAPAAAAVEYHVFGLVEGLLALLLSYILVLRGAWAGGRGPLGGLALAYGTLANAQIWELLLPAPGVLEWVVVTGIAFTAWGALGRGSRHRLVAALASLALLLAVLKFSVVPALWNQVGPAPGEALGLGNLAERSRRLLAGSPPEAGAQWIGVVAISLWTLGTALLWPRASRKRRRRTEPAVALATREDPLRGE